MRYMLKFSKEEVIKFTSHLDMVRLFKRAFQRSGIRLKFSAGFNPHPKMTIAQPLSLGYMSVGEWMEFETVADYEPEDIKNILSGVLPKGIRILEVAVMNEGEKSLASRCSAAEYTIGMCVDYAEMEERDIKARLQNDPEAERFLKQPKIIVTKRQIKNNRDVELDIKPMIHYVNISVVDNNIFVTTELSAGSNHNLSPELLIKALMDFYHFKIPRETIEILRTEILM